MYSKEDKERMSHICNLNLSRKDKMELLKTEFKLSESAASTHYYRLVSAESIHSYQNISKVVSENLADILNILSKNPQNLQNAFRMIGFKYDINANTLSKYWYGSIKNPLFHAKESSKIFMLCGDDTYVNKKNCSWKDKEEPSVLNKVNKFIKKLL